MTSKLESVGNGKEKSGALYLRPSEKVRVYLETELERQELRNNGRLPTIRQMAAQLNVSARTVQNVVGQLAREGKVRSQAGNGTFLIPPTNAGGRDEHLLALSIPVPNASMSPWVCPIYGGILHAATRASKVIKLQMLCRWEDGEEVARRKLLEGCAQTDGLILFSSPFSDEIRRTYEEHGKPVVDLNPPAETCTANFVSPDYTGSSFQLGKAWRTVGRRQVVIMLHVPLERSVSNRLRFAGLTNGLGPELGQSISCRVVVAGGVNEEDGYRVTRNLLKDASNPIDAIYCIGDFLALGSVRALREANRRVPEDVSVVGGSGLDLSHTAGPGLTRTQHPLEKVGETLVDLLEERIRLEGLALPGQFLPTPFIGGATTGTDENRLLGIQEAR
jgi:DNA-binding LacI/PurR family transcriptional regulator